MRKAKRQTSEEKALALLAGCSYATLSMVLPQEGAYCIPISPVILGNNVYFHCAKEGLKLDCLKEDGRVCLSCVGEADSVPERFTMRYTSAVVFGRATPVEDEQEKQAVLLKLCEKYGSAPQASKDYVQAAHFSAAVIKITVTGITGKKNLC